MTGVDQLDRDEREARKLGLSYGQYIAKFKPPRPPAERWPKKKKPQQAEDQQPRPRCACCGKEIPEDSTSRRYCGAECAHVYRKQMDSARHKQQREVEKALAEK